VETFETAILRTILQVCCLKIL